MPSYLDEIVCPGVTEEKTPCGNILSRTQKFCTECGTKILAVWFLEESDVCAEKDEDGNVCGQPLDSTAKFCPNCGARNKKRARPSTSYQDARLQQTSAATRTATLLSGTGSPSRSVEVSPSTANARDMFDELDLSADDRAVGESTAQLSEFQSSATMAQDSTLYFTPPDANRSITSHSGSSDVDFQDQLSHVMLQRLTVDSVVDDQTRYYSPVGDETNVSFRAQSSGTSFQERLTGSSSHQPGRLTEEEMVVDIGSPDTRLFGTDRSKVVVQPGGVAVEDEKRPSVDKQLNSSDVIVVSHGGQGSPTTHCTPDASAGTPGKQNTSDVIVIGYDGEDSPATGVTPGDVGRQNTSDVIVVSYGGVDSPATPGDSAGAPGKLDKEVLNTSDVIVSDHDTLAEDAKSRKQQQLSAKPGEESSAARNDDQPTGLEEDLEKMDVQMGGKKNDGRKRKQPPLKAVVDDPLSGDSGAQPVADGSGGQLQQVQPLDRSPVVRRNDVDVADAASLSNVDAGRSNVPAAMDSDVATLPGLPYNKKSTTPASYHEGTNRNKSTRPAAAATPARHTIVVHFHVMLPTSEFGFEHHNGDLVLMKFSPSSRLGGWKDDSHVMTIEKTIDDKNTVMQLDVEIDKDVVVRQHSCEYKYCVRYANGTELYEFLPRKVGPGGEIANRELQIDSDTINNRQLTEWHQYDGVLAKPDEDTEGFLSSITRNIKKWTGKSYEKSMKQNQLAAMAMLPDWKDLYNDREELRAERLLAKLDQVVYCMKISFVNEDVKPDQTQLAEMLSKYIEPAVNILKEASNKAETVVEAGVRLATSCCLIYIVQQYGLNFENLSSLLLTSLLLRPDPVARRCPDYEQLTSIHLASDSWRKSISGTLMNFMYRMVSSNFVEPRWLFAIPLWHLLSGTVKPFVGHEGMQHTTQGWWGIVDVAKLVEKFKLSYRNKIEVNMYVTRLGPMFEVDRLLPRTLLSVMSLCHVQQLYSSMLLPADACLANLTFFVRSETHMDHKKVLEPLLATLFDLVSSWMPNVAACPELLEDQRINVNIQHRISLDLYHEIRRRNEQLSKKLVVIMALKIVAATISNMQKLLMIAQSRGNISMADIEPWKRVIIGYFDDLFNLINVWLAKVLSVNIVTEIYYGRTMKYSTDELEIYQLLLDMKFFDLATTELWKTSVVNCIEKRLEKIDERARVFLFCEVDFSQFPREMEDCVSAAAFTVLENSTKTSSGDFDFLLDAANVSSGIKIRDLLSKMFEKAWPPSVDGQQPSNTSILQHIITWPSFHRFLSLFYGKSERSVLLSDRCQECIGISLAVFDDAIQQLLTGNLTISQLQFLVNGAQTFLEVFRVVEKNSEGGVNSVPASGIAGKDKADVLLRVLEWRKLEWNALSNMYKVIRHFVDSCNDLQSAEVNELWYELNRGQQDRVISSFCRPLIYSAVTSTNVHYSPTVMLFKLSASVRNMLVKLHEQADSILFQLMWTQQCRRVISQNSQPDGEQLTIDQIELKIWQPVYRAWSLFSVGMISGDIQFKAIDLFFASFSRKYDVIRKELEMVCSDNTAVVEQRVDQIRQYHQVDGYSRGAEAMLRLRDMFQLTGDFKDVEVLVDLVKDRTKSLKCITKELVDSGKQLQEITDRKVECLDVLIKNKKFADWLKKSLKGPKEVKVLVDLAMISAEGQGDLEVQKVSCLHAAATGYAPLIYDLKQNMGFKEFFPLCQAVWRSLENDERLPEKFKDTARQLEWLNRVKDSHGSVELNALANARAINERGIYTVGSCPILVHNTDTGHRKCLDNVVLLKLRLERGDMAVEDTGLSQEQIEKERWQTLSLQQLNDLQSKLMLVAGKASEGKEQVELFVEILDGITRLGNLYVQICNAGCTLFQNWKAIFYCCPDRPLCTVVEFGKAGKHKLTGKKNEYEKGVIDHIGSLCKFMEQCLKEWLQHIEVQRTDSYYLNHFTTEQLVILQTELSKVNSDEQKKNLSKNIYPLLSRVKHNCSLKDLEKAMYLAFRQEVEMENQPTLLQPSTAAADIDVNDDDVSAEEQNKAKHDAELELLETLEQSGFCRTLALKALKAVGTDDEAGVLWCMEHEMEDDDEMESDVDVDKDDEVDAGKDSSFGDWRKFPASYKGLQLNTTKDALTADLFRNIEQKGSLMERLNRLWSVYENEMNTSVSDYLSLLHLGALLEHLAQMDAVRLSRPMPGYLKKGRPNLIVCSQGEVLSVVLSLYMYGDGANIVLPGADEVLVCNIHSTAEDVELLWRRAGGDARGNRHGKIYALVHAELLDYEVSRRVEESLEKHSHAVDDLQLVVVCCRELEDRCHMINALDRYRVKLAAFDQRDIQTYLKQHFTVANVAGFTPRPAASLDPEGCCVRVIKSHRAGVGKTLKVKRLHEQLQGMVDKSTYGGPLLITIPLHCRTVDQSAVLKTLLEHTLEPQQFVPRIFHIDIAHEVQEGADYLLFNLLILGSITDREGFVWTRSPADLYVIETMPLMQRDNTRSSDKRLMQQQQPELEYVHHILHLLPTITCWSPMDTLEIANNNINKLKGRYTNMTLNITHDQTMDLSEFRSSMFQRPFQYLLRFDQRQELRGITIDEPEGTVVQCINTLLQHCGIEDPSWAELKHFVNFLDVQLRDCENSVFCSEFLAPDLPGFLNFVVQFMMQMSKDFATRSLRISEETPEVAMELFNQQAEDGADVENVLAHYGLKRTWETSPHPYLFFNADHNSFTFMGFVINMQTGDILEPTTNRVLTPQALPRPLLDALVRNRVNLSENFDQLNRFEKLTKMCNVMGIEDIYDPDPTYELTADNVKKMLAIYMRFRCHIPVIVMGETGCGKTRLIKFMCDLWKPPGAEVTNMILMKVHGGTTAKDILRKVHEAVQHAEQNLVELPDMLTVLFFDEANTTEDIGLIKEIMCDRTIRGQQLMETHGLKLIAACNPYRKHSDEMIQRLEHAGLGYHIEANQTTDKLGRIPMRQLVYRVQALPQSMLPLVWDFGQLNTDVEELYIRQMVHRYVNGIDQLRTIVGLVETISKLLAASQQFMRDQKDECSFVSLRDVDRTLQVMMWFYEHRTLFDLVDEKAVEEIREQNPDATEDGDIAYTAPNDVTRSLMLAVGVCYHACLEKRRQFRDFIARYFTGPCQLENTAETLRQNISWCQDVFLDGVELGPNIARNQALKENVFMMVVCIELRIPLFLVGKPGSSKSLAKTIVADAMQGEAARTELFRTLKSVHMVSYQCSPLSTPDGIVGIFRQCAKLQENQDLNKFVSVVVLDEVGLAEDSPRMPLKTLHPLLEDGCEGDEEPAAYKKVGFIGISNWALDPAKMNRGILVQRGVPDEPELEQSAKGICSSGVVVASRIDCLVRPMAKAYLELYKSTLSIREFFGLRDFYRLCSQQDPPSSSPSPSSSFFYNRGWTLTTLSLIKMVYGFASHSNHMPTWFELQHAILRNFGGLDDVQPVEVFAKYTRNIIDMDAEPLPTDPACDPASLIRASLTGDINIAADLDSESRYLLILTENYAALGILQQELLKIKDAIVIFGSSFPKDQEYTQVCRNINRIKVCMETGQTVVLLNLENLYESLYDALNQYYIKFGDQRFVDLGLGTQRVKCRVHLNFRLIVVAEKKVVYEKFPIPLINRLEKHFLAMDTMLTEEQRELAGRLERWAKDFTDTGLAPRRDHRGAVGSGPQAGDVFIGYHADTAASVILQVCQAVSARGHELDAEQILIRGKELLLRCATPESIVRLSQSRLAASYNDINRIYFKEQKHDNIMEFIEHNLLNNKPTDSVFLQVTTHSRLLLGSDAVRIARLLRLKPKHIVLQSLQAFDTEQQFCKMLKEIFGAKSTGSRLLILQCDSGDIYTDLIACARYNITNEFSQSALVIDDSAAVDGNTAAPLVHVLFIIQLPRIAGGCFVGFQGGRWICHHIDDLHPSQDHLPSLSALKEHSVSALFEAAVLGGDKDQTVLVHTDEQMDVEEPTDSFETMIVDDMEMVAMDTADSDSLRSQSGLLEAQQVVELNQKAMEGSSEQLDVEGIVRNCLHPAAAMLRDKETLRQRKTHRLQLLLSLLKPTVTGELCLMNVLKQRISLLLRDKEETAMSTVVANSWLSNEAASFQRINQAGTFRRALSQYLESRVTPLLAGLLAFIDSSNNLDVLGLATQDANLHWLSGLWLNMFVNGDVTTLKYRDLQTATQRMELTEFEVKTTGPASFTCQLPFSWIIKERVDLMIFNAKQQSKEDTRCLVERLLKLSPLGSVLDKAGAVAAGNCDEITERYLHDYIHMVYEPLSQHSDMEYQLIVADLKYEAKQRLNSVQQEQGSEADDAAASNSFVFPDQDGVLSIPAVHLMFDAIHRRVQIFSQLAQSWPQCVPTLAQATRVQPMPLDLKSLILLMESLTPVKDELDNVNTRLEWSHKVQSLNPIVEHLLESVGVMTSERLVPLRNRCRFTWNRICALQLFIQHVCPPGTKDQLSIRRCMPLWTSLGELADFKTDQSLKTIENFLRLCNKQASELHFGKTQCPVCSQPVEGPVKLPCGHVACLKCVVEMKEIGITACPETDCGKRIPASFKPEIIPAKKAAMEEHNRYKQRCNAFLMELVSRLCFTDSTPPEPAAVHRLMGYITCQSKVAEKLQQLRGTAVQTTRTKKMFDEAIDPTPIVRSFLLQLLLRADVDQVRIYLQEFLEEAHVLLQSDKEHIIELCLLCVQCLEDHYHATCSQLETVHQQLEYTKQLLREAHDMFASEDGRSLNILMLEAVAKTRYGMQLAAQWIYRLYVTNEKLDRQLSSDGRKLVAMSAYVCDLDQVKWPRLFLMKQIMQQFGMDVLKQVSSVREVKWLVPLDAQDNQNEVSADRFVVCGNNYKQLRELLAEIVLGKDIKSLAKIVKAMKDSVSVRDRNLLLAIYREITLNTGSTTLQTPDQVLQQLSDFCQKNAVVMNKDLAIQLLHNTLPDDMLQVPGQSPADRSIIEMLVHFNIVVVTLQNCQLMQPLIALVACDRRMANAFLPTMPQDDLADVKEAVRTAGENPTFYQCANGHPYVIGNATVSQAIGDPDFLVGCEKHHRSVVDRWLATLVVNVVYVSAAMPMYLNQQIKLSQSLTTHDVRTLPWVWPCDVVRRLCCCCAERLRGCVHGHILGTAPPRRVPIPERQMTAASTAILRLFTHMAMYLGAMYNVQVISSMIDPRVADVNVPQFLWQHMLCDIDTIHTAIGRSFDDVVVLVHLLVDSILTIGAVGYRDDVHLSSKQTRQLWENAFVNQYITHLLVDMNNRLQKAHNDMVNDERLGNNPLMRLLYEVDVDVKSTDQILETPSLWRYRARVSLEHVKRELEQQSTTGTGKNKNKKESPFPVLELFLKEERQLQAVRLLPNIMHLHRLLLKRFNRSIDLAEATSMTIATFLDSVKEDNVRLELFDLIKDFIVAWDCVRPSFVNYVFGGRTLPTEYVQMSVSEMSCLAVLLPSLRGYGLCSVALTYFLFQKQNNFLEAYSLVTKQKLEVTGIDIRDAGGAHLVSFHPERDLLPIILSNCNYSLELGKGTRIEYDFMSMEKQVEERFIRGRPRLQYQVDFVLFREDFTNAAVFAELRSRIPQEPLVNTSSIEKELRQKLPEVNDLLASLDITVGFLVSVAGDPNASLVKFMTETLQMKHRQQLINVIQSSCLKHVESLWLLLSYMRACMQANYGQDPFDTVEDKYREKIPDELIDKVKLGLQHINIETFLPGLHECILFRMAVKQDINHEDYVDNVDQPLNYVLHEYLEEKGVSIPALTDGRFPADVKVKHCVAIWRLAHKPAHRRR